MIYTTVPALHAIRERLRSGKGNAAVSAAWLRWKAEEIASLPTVCLTDHPSPAVSGDPHDYFSEGPYWWPDPENPDGPYIRRDGYINPDRFEDHYIAFENIQHQPLTLTLAAFHLGEEKYADAALKKLHSFFVCPETRMHPHMNCAQAIRGVCDGRGIGIIEARHMTRIVFTMELLAEMGIENETTAGMRTWLSEFYHWLRTSPNGVEESNEPNNHATFYTVVTMSLARFLGDSGGFLSDCSRFCEMMSSQMSESGEFPLETARTDSFGYSCANLNGAAIICEIAHFGGVDLWNRSFGGERSMSRAVQWLAPYLIQPFTWPFPTIGGIGDASAAMLSASRRLRDGEGKAAAQKALSSYSTWDPRRNVGPCGPMEFYFSR